MTKPTKGCPLCLGAGTVGGGYCYPCLLRAGWIRTASLDPEWWAAEIKKAIAKAESIDIHHPDDRTFVGEDGVRYEKAGGEPVNPFIPRSAEATSDGPYCGCCGDSLVWGLCAECVGQRRPEAQKNPTLAQATKPARLDVDGTAKPLTEIAAVVRPEVIEQGQCLLHDHQIASYVVRPSAGVMAMMGPKDALNATGQEAEQRRSDAKNGGDE